MSLIFKFNMLCRKYNFSPKKRLSQNFLVNQRIIDLEVLHAELNENDVVLEIGAGMGFLTERLLEKAQKVIAVEIDKRLVNLLKNEFRNNKKLELVHADILNMDITSLKVTKVVSNVPYHIASPLLFKLTELNFKLAILTFQEEFAMRLVANPCSNEYGRLSVTSNLYYDIYILEKVPASAFFPKSKVDSMIVKLIPHPKLPIQYLNNPLTKEILIWLFNSKKQKAIKNLKRFIKNSKIFHRKNHREKFYNMLPKFAYLEKKSYCLTLNEIVLFLSEVYEQFLRD